MEYIKDDDFKEVSDMFKKYLNIASLLLASALIGITAPVGMVKAHTIDDGCETKSLFVNLSSGRVQRTHVAFLVAQANLSGADVTVFLADEAAHLVLRPEFIDLKYLHKIGYPKGIDHELDTLYELQEVDEENPLPSLKELQEMGVTFYGCPLCVNGALAKGLTIFNPGGLDMDAWYEYVLPDILPIAPEDFDQLYNRPGACNAAVISF
jgi:predicted peroxiredoxin